MSAAPDYKIEPGGDRSLPRGKFTVLLTASLVSSLIMLDSNIVAVSLPAIGRSLSASFTDIQWVISAYVLTYAALLLATGSYADLRGRRKAMLIGLVVFASASAACGIATSSLTLNVARGVQGVGGAFLLTASLAIISAEFTGEARAGAFAFWGAGLGIALAVGPIIGGAITNVLGWRWIFLVNVPVCALLVAATLSVVAESRDPAARQLRLASTDPALGRVIDAVIARIGPQRIAPSRSAPFGSRVRANRKRGGPTAASHRSICGRPPSSSLDRTISAKEKSDDHRSSSR